MKWLMTAGLSAVAGFCAAGAWAEVPVLMQEQREQICHQRKTCEIADVREAGTSPDGRRLGVAEVHLGIEDRPGIAPDEGCISADFQSRDGGVEYWLLDGPQPRLLLQLCNDGYGASGVGEDQVDIGDNSLVHTQFGGSAWRWSETRMMTLVPLRTVGTRGCSYHNISPGNGVTVDIDRVTWLVRSLGMRMDPDTEEAGLGCPAWTDETDRAFSPEPAAGVVAGFNILLNISNTGYASPGLANGQMLADCALSLSSDGSAGFLVHGDPAPGDEAAHLSVLADTGQSLVLQIQDPTAADEASVASAASWIHRPHAEIWISPEWDDFGGNPPPEDRLQQIGVEWDGRVHHGFGSERPLPAAERWQGRNASGQEMVVLRLTWPSSTDMGRRMGVAYSQSKNGRQARLVASTGIVKNRPLYLPELIPTRALSDDDSGSACVNRDGALSRRERP